MWSMGAVSVERAKKRMNRVVIIATDFPPNPSVGRRRTVKFLKHLPGLGWECSVLAPSERYFRGKDPALRAEVPPGVRVFRAFHPAPLEMCAARSGKKRKVVLKKFNKYFKCWQVFICNK